jgi:hypothetical protein
MFCANCGASNKKDSKFCFNCGEPISEAEVGERLPRTRALKKVSYVKKVEFLWRFFDFSFSRTVSPKIVKFLYGLSILFSAVLALSFIIVGFNTSPFLGLLALFIVAPLTFLLTVIFGRVLLKTILLILRMSDRVENVGLVKLEDNPESKDGIRWNV